MYSFQTHVHKLISILQFLRICCIFTKINFISVFSIFVCTLYNFHSMPWPRTVWNTTFTKLYSGANKITSCLLFITSDLFIHSYLTGNPTIWPLQSEKISVMLQISQRGQVLGSKPSWLMVNPFKFTSPLIFYLTMGSKVVQGTILMYLRVTNNCRIK